MRAKKNYLTIKGLENIPKTIKNAQICEYAYDLLYLLNPKYQPSASRIPFKKGLNPVYDLRDYTL